MPFSEPITFTELDIKIRVFDKAKGNYRIGNLINGDFVPKYVGRSTEDDLRGRLLVAYEENKGRLDKYTRFAFMVQQDDAACVAQECQDWHTFPGLDND